MDRLLTGLLFATLTLGCSLGTEEEPLPGDDDDDYTDAVRIVAAGDFHGDLEQTRLALQLAGVIDDNDTWCGGETILVHTGDELDRGDGDREIFDLLEALTVEATVDGGEVYPITGNHEVMNVQLDFRYITDASFASFADIEYDPEDEDLLELDEEQRGRAAAFRPGGPYAMMLAERPVILELEDTLFVHGGVLPDHVADGIDHINEDVAEWMRGEDWRPKAYTSDEDSPVWSRHFSDDPDEEDCALAEEVLDELGLARMVVGHTIQDDGIDSACDGLVWRIDIGMSEYYGHAEPQVLVIQGDHIEVLTY